ncbi:efflux RND transporter permease subunit [Glaciimonas sp. Gout2]|uniref:efflux RND transporter permease subunit n=1 Tax=unclassified Glaciimonas TaxID=2644401 RepID=UPI002B2278EE|nr:MULTISPECIES: efflux RND transporter permease subunit [unclassified Glaciimonas]MEB0014223.1 efflux RND transporter permease subunit [Glaciimonas sp. Cout2]MEB0084041.1 efflux RND transporter permease subunit [Glaciimonas sp. Gout2]
MNISELCIRRPIMTVLLSVAIVVLGVFSYSKLPIAALPSYNTPVINVSGSLPGASPEIMAASVATPLEKQFSTIPGLATISSTNTLGSTSITLEFNSDRDIDAAAVDVQAALLRAQRNLPVEMTSLPAYRKVNPADAAVLLLGLTSPSLSLADLNDYAENLISPSLSTIAGVAQVAVYGQRRYAVRVKAKSDQLAARNMTMDELAIAIKAANANSPVGVLDGPRQSLTIQANKQLANAAAFSDLVIKSQDGSSMRLKDVAEVEDSVESTKSGSWVNGEPSIVLAVQRQPDANTVAVVDAVKATLPQFKLQMPASINVHILNDRSVSIRDAIADVKHTLLLTVVLVILVIFLFLKRLSATVIPVLSLPISLIGCCALMLWFGYSLDNISLLAITIAVGLVVDDAIVMLENIVRYVEQGMDPMTAALKGSKEVGFTIISISISLVAVFIPIFFMPGVIGLMFHEFAAVVSLAIMVSAVVSLTLVPMLCSRYLKHQNHEQDGWLSKGFERGFHAVLNTYTRGLDWCLMHRHWVLGGAVATFVLTGVLFATSPKGFFPTEDIGQIGATVEGPQDISYPAMVNMVRNASEIIGKDVNVESVTSRVSGTNSGSLFIGLKARKDRATMDQVLEGLRAKLSGVAGMAVYMTPVQNLRLGGRSSKSRYQYTLQSVRADELTEWAERIQVKMRADSMFRDVTSDSQMNGLQASINIDRDRANDAGVQIDDIRTALYSAYGDRQVSTIFTSSNSYQVILQGNNSGHQDEADLSKIYLRSKTGILVPLLSVATVKREPTALSVNHQGQLQAVTISFNLAPDVPLGNASQKIDLIKAELSLPASIIATYGGDAAVFQSSQSSQVVLLVLAVAVIYILLGVLYESYIHPITILAGLPSAAIGALLALRIFGFELTLIATIGILMLIGIVKKNAIMMIDFALDAQRSQGLSPVEAIRTACILRFRPIMMTTLAALMGAIPIALGLGAGAELRQPLGVAIVGGLLVSQVITLFITPVIYLLLDRYSGTGPLQLIGDKLPPKVQQSPQLS